MATPLKLMTDSRGGMAIEYALIAALIALAGIGAIEGVGASLEAASNNTSAEV